MSRRLYLFGAVVLSSLALLLRGVECGYLPLYGRDSDIEFGGK